MIKSHLNKNMFLRSQGHLKKKTKWNKSVIHKENHITKKENKEGEIIIKEIRRLIIGKKRDHTLISYRFH